jgi:hypothetical protein
VRLSIGLCAATEAVRHVNRKMPFACTQLAQREKSLTQVRQANAENSFSP